MQQQNLTAAGYIGIGPDEPSLFYRGLSKRTGKGIEIIIETTRSRSLVKYSLCARLHCELAFFNSISGMSCNQQSYSWFSCDVVIFQN